MAATPLIKADVLGMAMDNVDEEDARVGVVGRGRKVDRIIAEYHRILFQDSIVVNLDPVAALRVLAPERCWRCGKRLKNPFYSDGAAYGRVCVGKVRPVATQGVKPRSAFADNVPSPGCLTPPASPSGFGE